MSCLALASQPPPVFDQLELHVVTPHAGGAVAHGSAMPRGPMRDVPSQPALPGIGCSAYQPSVRHLQYSWIGNGQRRGGTVGLTWPGVLRRVG